MRKFLKALVFILCIIPLASLPVQAKAAQVSVNDLIENEKEYDGKEVTIQGEAIGEKMVRGDHAWINVNDGTNAIGIWIDKSEADRILHYGNYKYIGDTVTITGIFHRACKEHGGEADVHSNSLTVTKAGYSVKENINIYKVIMTVILVPIALIMLIYFRKKVNIGK